MKITIAIPVYNTEPYVDRCLTSIFKQSFTDFEIIIVNDASPNNNHNQSLADIVQSYDNTKISIITNSVNKGLFQARLTALRQAQGDYICFVDSDDWLERTYLEDLYKSITQNNTDIAISGFYYSKSNKKRIKSSANLTNTQKYLNNDADVTNVIYKEKIRHCIWNKLYKKDTIIQSQILNITDTINQSEDLLLNCYAFLEAKSISIISKPLYNYFLNEQSMTNDFSLNTFKSRVNSIIIVMEKIKQLLSNNNIDTKFKEDFQNRYIQQSYYLISILQRANLEEEIYFQGFNYMINNIDHEYVIKALKRSPVLKIANLIENKILPPLTLRRYWMQILYNKINKMFRKS